jgi:hypothetical protein
MGKEWEYKEQVSYFGVRVWVSVFYTTFNNIAVISWQSILLVEQTVVPRKPPTCRKSLTNFIT